MRIKQTSTKGIYDKARLGGIGDPLKVVKKIEFWLYYKMIYV